MSVVVGYVMRILGEAYIEWIAVVAAVTATDVLGNLFFILFNQCILLFFLIFLLRFKLKFKHCNCYQDNRQESQ